MCSRCLGYPIRAPLEARGHLFLPIDKGEAGLLYPCSKGSALGEACRGTGSSPLSQRNGSVGQPRGGGLVVIVAMRRLSVEGRVTSSGEPGWGCEGAWDISSAGGVESQGLADRPEQRKRCWGLSERLKSLFRSLLGAPARLRSLSRGGTTTTAAASCCTHKGRVPACATGGSGGSIVLVAESLSFASPMQSGQVTASGGGCSRAPPNWPPKSGSKGSQGPHDTLSGDCAAGGGGRIAIYAEQPHPLDPVVSAQYLAVSVRIPLYVILQMRTMRMRQYLVPNSSERPFIKEASRYGCLLVVVLVFQVVATGGCASRSSRLDLLPCLCGGGGTIFSLVHRRLVIANKLTSAAAASRAPEASLNVRVESATPRSFQNQQSNDEPSVAIENRPTKENEEEESQTRLTSSHERSLAGSSTATESVAVLSIQPTPLPVPLHAPSITVAVEAAVVTIEGPPVRPQGDTDSETGGFQAFRSKTHHEPKVVIGSLLLHGGTRGEVLFVWRSNFA